MISHEEFGKLRLAPFAEGHHVDLLDDWEYMGDTWVGEAIGFTEWLRRKSDPDVLGALSLDLVDLPSRTAAAVMKRVGLPLRRGMTLESIQAVLGAPRQTRVFVADRRTYEFKHGHPDSFSVGCTLLHEGGLVHLTIRAGT